MVTIHFRRDVADMIPVGRDLFQKSGISLAHMGGLAILDGNDMFVTRIKTGRKHRPRTKRKQNGQAQNLSPR